MERAALSSLSRDDLVALVLTQHARIEAQAQEIVALTARIAALESRLEGPAKTPDNSSVPPSKGQKADLPAGRRKRRRRGHPGVTRALAEHRPDRCGHARGLPALRPRSWPDRPAGHSRLRPHRSAVDAPDGDAHPPPSWHLPVLPQAGSGAGVGGVRSPARRSAPASSPWCCICTSPRRSGSSGCPA